jgi:poly-gamma-glutamate synthesis protein (capsule biosynthesis protein)
LAETVATLEEVGIGALVDLDIGYSGFGIRAESPNPRIYEFPDTRIAFLAFCDTGRPLDTDAISRAATQADLLVVSVHWGAEYYPVTARQRALARQLVAAGADLIVGHGPHVLQPVEWVDGALVAYSLGNFLFDQPFPDTRQGAILRLTLDRGSITAVEAIPTVMRRGRVHPATGDEAAAILNKLQLNQPTNQPTRSLYEPVTSPHPGPRARRYRVYPHFQLRPPGLGTLVVKLGQSAAGF